MQDTVASLIRRILISTSLTSALVVPLAFGQQTTQTNQATTGPDAAQGSEEGGQLQEVTVTATRFAEPLNKVPASLTATTQVQLTHLSVTSSEDLQRLTPELTVAASTTNSIANYTIRGVQTTSGAPTTGVYLDDVPLQKRNQSSADQSNGTPLPPIFGIDHVEVLRGPQGTLFGGSSMGGTIRVLTPDPSLTSYTASAKLDGAAVDDGGLDRELGGLISFPIVNGKLAVGLMGWTRYNAGWMTVLNPYLTGAPVETTPAITANQADAFSPLTDANWDDDAAVRGKVLFQPTDDLAIRLLTYYSTDQNSGWSSTTNLSTPAISTASLCFPTVQNAKNANPISCSSPLVAYKRPSMSFGPYTLGQNDELGVNGGLPSPFESDLKVGSLTIDYNAHFALVKLITSGVKDVTRGFATGNFLSSANPVGAGQCPTCAPGYQPLGGLSLYSLDPDAFYTFPSDAERRGYIEELRFTSPDPNSALTWVGGLYYSHFVAMTEASNGINETTTEAGADTAYESLFGPTWNTQSTLGVENGATAPIPWNSTPGIPPGVVMQRFQTQRDVEEAAYGDLNYTIAHQLTVTGGLRVSHDYFQYNQEAWGMEAGYYPTPYGNSNYVHGTQVANPPTPRGVLSYQINPDDMVYVSASKGFREGGVNSTLVSGQCTPALAILGFTPTDFPTTYRADSLWSYEAGPKLRLFNDTLEINASAYLIDWSNIQTSVTVPGCAIAYVTNAGKAESNGFDFQVQQAVGPLVLSASLGYDNAFYTKAVAGPKSKAGVVSPVVLPGSPLPIPPWQLTAGVNYNFRIKANYAGYLQVEDYWQSSYINGTAPGTTSYSPDTRNLPDTNRVDLRIGTLHGRWDWSLYANNLLDARDVLAKGGGRSGCPISEGAACTTPTSYNPLITETLMPPLTVGLTALFSFR